MSDLPTRPLEEIARINKPEVCDPVPSGFVWCSARIDQIAAALAKAQADMPACPFDEENPAWHSRYASLGSVISSSRAFLGKYGLALIQVANMDKDKGTISVQTRLLHESGQWLDGGLLETVIGDDNRRSILQVAGGAITYMRRYSRMAMLQQYGDQDTDGNGKSAAEQKAQKPAGPSAEQVKERWDRLRLRLLNRLLAAPGQQHRAPFTDYMIKKGWISAGQTPEDWPTQHIPQTDEAWVTLTNELREFIDRPERGAEADTF